MMNIFTIGNRGVVFMILFCLVGFLVTTSTFGQDNCKRDSLIFEDEFDDDLSNWIIENKLSE